MSQTCINLLAAAALLFSAMSLVAVSAKQVNAQSKIDCPQISACVR